MLIEVLVALLLFSLGILGMVAMQARASQLAADSEDRTKAALLANDMAATMWAQLSTTVDDSTLSTWQTKVAATSSGAYGTGLPNGKGTVATDSSSVATITITWKPLSANSSATSKQYITKVVLP
jgi:type IV pilus assembly protein PilV